MQTQRKGIFNIFYPAQLNLELFKQDREKYPNPQY